MQIYAHKKIKKRKKKKKKKVLWTPTLAIFACTTEVKNGFKNLCSITEDFQAGFCDKSR